MNFFAGFAPFLDYRYWLNPSPVPLGPSLVGSMAVFFAWFLIAAVVLYLVARSMRRHDRLKADICRRAGNLMLTVGLLSMLELFFAYEQVPVLGMRLWFLVILVVFIEWLVKLVVFAVRDYPVIRRQEEERARFEKYLPKSAR
ncbi:MAG: hypothetical protein ABIJ46_00945 [bacterium]